MSISINREKCTGCGKCANVCPGSLLKFTSEQKAYIRYPKDCWGCCSCLKECSQGAIFLYLGADIGGMGSRLTTKIEEDIIHWQIEKWNGDKATIDVNRHTSNQY